MVLINFTLNATEAGEREAYNAAGEKLVESIRGAEPAGKAAPKPKAKE